MISPKPAYICLIRIKGRRKLIEDAQRVKDPQRYLHADRAIASFKANDGVARDPRTISELGLRQPPKLAPRLQASCKIAQRPADRQRSGSRGGSPRHNVG